MDPLFTIIVPTYNVADYLNETLDSIVKQSYTSYEIIMIDDGATDGSDVIAKNFAELHENATYIRTEREGVSGSRNHGMEEAKGQWLIFVDGDDVLPADALQAYADQISVNGDSKDIYFGQMEEFQFAGETVYRMSERISKKVNIETLDTDILSNLMVTGKAFRKAFADEKAITFPALRYSEDAAFLMAAVYSGARLGGVPAVTYSYRKRSPLGNLSVTQLKEDKLWDDFIEAHIDIFTRFELYAADNNILEGVNLYREQLYNEVIRKTISDFYRNMWVLSETTMSQVVETISFYMSHLSDDVKTAIIDDNKDLYLDNEIATKKNYFRDPHYYITYDNNISEDAARKSLQSLYAQGCPAFIVRLPERLKSLGLNYKNIIFMEETPKPASGFAVDFDKSEEAMERLNTRVYALDLYVDKAICFSNQLLTNIYNEALKKEANWVFSPVLKFKTESKKEETVLSKIGTFFENMKFKFMLATHKGCLEFRNHKEDYPEKEPSFISRDTAYIVK